MIKTELRFIIPTTSPVGASVPVVGNGVVGTYTNLMNSNFNYYTNGWEAASIGTSASIYPNLYNDGTLQSIPDLNGWTWNNGWLITNQTSTLAMWQTLSGITIGEYYQIDFDLKDVSGCTITPRLCGTDGTPVSSDGHYTQYIQVNSIGTGENGGLSFRPTTGTAGISKVTILPTGNNYRKIDLYDDEDFNLTFQIQNSISNKSSTFSKTITLPGTSNNNIIFNSLFEESLFIDFVTSTPSTTQSIFFNKKIRAGIYDESIELLTGNFELNRVLNTDGDIQYEGVFYTNIKNIADSIGDVMITGNSEPDKDDIDISQYNHTFTWLNIQSTWQGIGYNNSTGIYYPMIDYANVESGNFYKVEQFRPSIYVKEIWDRIFQRAGFTYTSTFLNSDIFKSLIVPEGNTKTISDFNLENTKFDVGITSSQNVLAYLTGVSSPSWTSLSEKIKYDKIDSIFYNPIGIYNTSTFIFENTGGTASYNFNVNVVYAMKIDTLNGTAWCRGVNTQPYIDVVFELVRVRSGVVSVIGNSPFIDHDFVLNSNFASGTWFIPEKLFNFSVENEICLNGDKFYVQIHAHGNTFWPYKTGSQNTTPNPGILTIRLNQYGLGSSSGTTQNEWILAPSNDLTNYYTLGSIVYANDISPKMKQLEFISSICNKFCLMFCEDKSNSKNLIIEPYDNFYYTGGTTYIDWSKKIDLNKEKWIERIPYLIDKDLQFSMNKDGNDVNLKMYSDSNNTEFGNYLIKNPYYSGGVEKIEDKFSSTMLENFGDTDKIVSKIFSDMKPTEYNGFPTKCEYSPRILSRKYLTTTHVTPIIVVYDQNSTIGNGTGVTLGVFSNKYPYAGYLSDPYVTSPTTVVDLNYGVANYYDTNYNTTRNLFWLYWKNKIYQYMNPNSKLVTIWLRLTPTDISLLDFRKRIILNNNLYRLNKIIEWTPNGNSCKVELFQDAVLDSNAYITPTTWKSKITPISPTANQVPDIRGTISMDGIILTPPNIVYYPSNYSSYSGETNLNSSDFTSYPSTLQGNTICKRSASIIIGTNNTSNAKSGIIIGGNNLVNSNIYFVKGHSNVVTGNATDATIIGSNNNTVANMNDTIIGSNSNIVLAPNVLIIGGNNNIANTGNTTPTDNQIVIINSSYNTLTGDNDGTVLINSSGQTISESGKTYINNRDVDTLTDVTYVDNNYFNKSQNIIMSGGTILNIPLDGIILIGPKDTEGSWKIYLDGSSVMHFQNYRSGSWRAASQISPA